jgi:lipoyl(octanoyl) transferase
MMLGDDIEWRISEGLQPYPETLAEMEARNEAVRAGTAPELVWLLEHPPLYTAGTSATQEELILRDRFPVYPVGRGGRYTYHGPGQRVGYLMLDLTRRGRDVRHFVHALERWLIGALRVFDVEARMAEGRVGIWVDHGDTEAKIGAIGVRVRRWVTLHGFAVNIDPDLSHFGGIVPCGLPDYPVTSLADLGRPADMKQFDEALRLGFPSFLSDLGGS